ncbi:MAG TPA: TRAP transporter small permease [Synergistaceae bacterium]|nr:TRAP transporter small permease [Synergistaceae bacterium]
MNEEKRSGGSLFSLLKDLDIFLASLVLVVLVILTFSGVIMRYLVGRPYTWLEEVQMACMVWIVFASSGAAFVTGSHVAIEMVVEALPLKMQKVLELLIACVVTFVICYLAFESVDYIKLMLRSRKHTSMLVLPYSRIYGIVPVSCALMLLKYYYALYRKRSFFRRTRMGAEP